MKQQTGNHGQMVSSLGDGLLFENYLTHLFKHALEI